MENDCQCFLFLPWFQACWYCRRLSDYWYIPVEWSLRLHSLLFVSVSKICCIGFQHCQPLSEDLCQVKNSTIATRTPTRYSWTAIFLSIMFSRFLLHNQQWTHYCLWHVHFRIPQTALQHAIMMCYITVVTHALVICLICMHSPSGLRLSGSCIHIRKITRAHVTTITCDTPLVAS